MSKPNKKAFKMPHTFVIITMIILAATALTWIIPAGQFVRYENEAGITVIDPNQFSYIDRTPVNPFLIPLFIVKAMCSRIDLMLVVLFSGGAFGLVTESGALHSTVAKLARLFQHRLYIFIPIMTTVFALIGTTLSVNQFIAFAPVLVMITLAMGLDSLTGAAIILLGGAVGFSTGTLNPDTTLVAQEIADLPGFSGLGFRAAALVVFLIVTNIYLVRYAMKVQKNPASSFMYDLDQQNEQRNLSMDSFGTPNARKVLIICALIAALAGIIYGCIAYSWGMQEIAATFIGLAVVAGFLDGKSPSAIAGLFIDGCKKMLTAMLVIGLATAIANIMTAGNIIDTVVHAMATMLSHTPRFLMAPAMYFVDTLVNIVLVSGSGKAAAVMPIMVPLADLLGITRQTAVVAYNLGDGFCNYILPHSTALMGIISAVNIPYDRWMKFMWKMFLIWFVVSCITVSIAQAIHLGPM